MNDDRFPFLRVLTERCTICGFTVSAESRFDDTDLKKRLAERVDAHRVLSATQSDSCVYNQRLNRVARLTGRILNHSGLRESGDSRELISFAKRFATAVATAFAYEEYTEHRHDVD